MYSLSSIVFYLCSKYVLCRQIPVLCSHCSHWSAACPCARENRNKVLCQFQNVSLRFNKIYIMHTPRCLYRFQNVLPYINNDNIINRGHSTTTICQFLNGCRSALPYLLVRDGPVPILGLRSVKP